MFTKRNSTTIECSFSTKRRRVSFMTNEVDLAHIADDFNSFPLHKACGDLQTPMKNIKEIYEAFPLAALTIDDFGYTPLMKAIEVGHEEAVQLLTSVCPRSISTYDGRQATPLQAAFEFPKATKMIKYILTALPEASLIPDYRGETPIEEFFKYFNVQLRLAIKECKDHQKLSEIKKIKLSSNSWTVDDLYQNFIYFLIAASISGEDNHLPENWMPLHESLKHRSCPWSFTKLLLLYHPEQVLKQDQDGNLPIHIILDTLEEEDILVCGECFEEKKEVIHFELETGYINECCSFCFNDQTDNVKKFTHLTRINRTQNIINELLSTAPLMAFIPSSKGKYPLQIAIENKKTLDIVNKVFWACPTVSKICDLRTQLLPFMLAAKGTWENETEQLGIVFQLLIEDPSLIHEAFHCCKGSH